MKELGVIIEMTPFLFEDGKIYYFQILKREYSNDYHDIFVYEKIEKVSRNFWGRVEKKEEFKLVNKRPELVSVNLDADEIKKDIKKILVANKAKYQLKDWDGFVGNIPDDLKVAIKRDVLLGNILGDGQIKK
jgi:hypothetical protein